MRQLVSSRRALLTLSEMPHDDSLRSRPHAEEVRNRLREALAWRSRCIIGYAVGLMSTCTFVASGSPHDCLSPARCLRLSPLAQSLQFPGVEISSAHEHATDSLQV